MKKHWKTYQSFTRTNASIVLTTTHRINYDETRWKEIFRLRGLNFETISKLNNKTEISQLLDKEAKLKSGLKTKDKNITTLLLMMTNQ
jgi:hypothetical protein